MKVVEIVGVVLFYLVVFAIVLLLRYAARADVHQWHGGRR